MVRILAPNTAFSGTSASVTFVNGVGETDNPHLIEWFRNHGFTVDEPAPAAEKKTTRKKE